MKKKLLACVLLLLLLPTACGQKVSLQETIPTLSLIAESGQSTPVDVFGYSWTAGRESVVADTVHPLEALETLPSLSVPAGTSVNLRFSRLPGSVTLTCWSAGDAENAAGAESRELETTFVNNGFSFVPPESGEKLVFVAQGEWSSREDAYGTAGFAFVLEQN